MSSWQITCRWSASIAGIAAAEKINVSYVGRVLRLTLLASDIVEAILNGEKLEIILANLLKPLSIEWHSQK